MPQHSQHLLTLFIYGTPSVFPPIAHTIFFSSLLAYPKFGYLQFD